MDPQLEQCHGIESFPLLNYKIKNRAHTHTLRHQIEANNCISEPYCLTTKSIVE